MLLLLALPEGSELGGSSAAGEPPSPAQPSPPPAGARRGGVPLLLTSDNNEPVPFPQQGVTPRQQEPSLLLPSCRPATLHGSKNKHCSPAWVLSQTTLS